MAKTMPPAGDSEGRARPKFRRVHLRLVMLTHPREAKRETAALLQPGCTPWYADALPLRIFQHWAPSPFVPVTFCGRVAGERSSSEIRTRIGWHCRKCQRRAKAALRPAGPGD